MKIYNWKHVLAPTLTLFTSASTLICCALPALLVTLGMGAVMAGLASNYPELIWLSEHKVGLFTTSGLLLLSCGYMMYRARNLACPADKAQAAACNRLRKISIWVYTISVTIYVVGFFFAFLAAKVLG